MSALKGDHQIAPQEIYANNVTTQGTDLGARMTTGDGRVFRYAVGSGTALVAGKLYQSSPQDSTNWQKLGVASAAGTLTNLVTIGSSVTLAANILSNGFLTVRMGQGSGFGYRIRSHNAVSAGTVTFTLDDPLQVALATSSVVDVVPNPYQNVIVTPTTISGVPVGVSVQNGTANGYVWLQTRGVADLVTDTAVTVGVNVGPSIATAGFIQAAAGSQPIIGYSMITSLANQGAPVFLTIE